MKMTPHSTAHAADSEEPNISKLVRNADSASKTDLRVQQLLTNVTDVKVTTPVRVNKPLPIASTDGTTTPPPPGRSSSSTLSDLSENDPIFHHNLGFGREVQPDTHQFNSSPPAPVLAHSPGFEDETTNLPMSSSSVRESMDVDMADGDLDTSEDDKNNKVVSGIKRRRACLTSSSDEESNKLDESKKFAAAGDDDDRSSDESSSTDRAAVDPKNILEPFARRAATKKPAAKRVKRTEPRTAAKKNHPKTTMNTATGGRRNMSKPKTVPRNRNQGVKTAKEDNESSSSSSSSTSPSDSESDSDLSIGYSSPLAASSRTRPLPIRTRKRKSKQTGSARSTTRSRSGYDNDLKETQLLIKTLQDDLNQRDKRIKELQKTNKNLTEGMVRVSSALEEKKGQLKMSLLAQKKLCGVVKRVYKGKEGVEELLEGLGGEGYGDEIVSEEDGNGGVEGGYEGPFVIEHTEEWNRLQQILEQGGRDSMARHIKGYYIGELSKERYSLVVEEMEEMSVEELEEVVAQTEIGKEIRKKDWGFGRAHIKTDTSADVIDLTHSSPSSSPQPAGSSSLMPTSSPKRAEDQIVVLKGVSGC